MNYRHFTAIFRKCSLPTSLLSAAHLISSLQQEVAHQAHLLI